MSRKKVFSSLTDTVCKWCDPDNEPCTECNYYMISVLRDCYPKESAELYKKIKLGTIKELNNNQE